MSNSFSIRYGSVFSNILAKENLLIQIEPSATTASISLKSRVLTLPQWEGSDSLQRFLMCHEVSHALHTPAKGWIDAIEEKPESQQPIYKDILNIFEDARIDRLIQQKFVIMKKWYYLGVKEFVIDRDIWGLEKSPTKEYSFLNRINIFFKTKPLDNRYGISFEPAEQKWIDRIEYADTFEEIKKIADDFFNELPEEEKETIEIFFPFGKFEVNGDGFGKSIKVTGPSNMFKSGNPSGTKFLKKVDYRKAIIRPL